MRWIELVGWLCGLVVACSSGKLDPAEPADVGGDGGATQQNDGGEGGSGVPVAGAGAPSSTDGGAPPSEAGGGGEPSGGGEAGAGPSDDGIFGDAPAYEALIAPTARELCGRNPSGTACLDCHNVLHQTPFSLGGTVFADEAAQVPAAGVEIRVVDAAGHGYSTHSDVEGNFWLTRAQADGAPPYRIGVRDSSVVREMPISPTFLDCNSAACHGGPIGRIRLATGD